MRDALEMMERCHHRLAEEAARLRAVTDAGEVDEILAFFARTTARHFADEEESLFPRLGSEHAALVHDLVADHRAHEALLHEMRTVRSAEALAPLARRFQEALTTHAAREDRELLPLAAALPREDQEAMAAEMAARRGGGRGGGGRGGGGRGGGGGGGGGERRGR